MGTAMSSYAKRFLLGLSLIPQMSVPTGDPAFTADEVLPRLNWNYGWEINDRLSVAGSAIRF